MKNLTTKAVLVFGALVWVAGSVAQAAAKKEVETGKALKTPPKNLSRELVFDGSSVNGRYHSAGEAVAKVEQEKKMNALIGLRSDYKDRLQAERERLKKGEPVSAE